MLLQDSLRLHGQTDVLTCFCLAQTLTQIPTVF
jgi:hypothetical protein